MEILEPGEEGLLLADVAANIVEAEPFNGYHHEFAGSILIALGVTGMSIGTLMAGGAHLDITNPLCQAGTGIAAGFAALFVGGTLLYFYSCYASRPPE